MSNSRILLEIDEYKKIISYFEKFEESSYCSNNEELKELKNIFLINIKENIISMILLLENNRYHGLFEIFRTNYELILLILFLLKDKENIFNKIKCYEYNKQETIKYNVKKSPGNNEEKKEIIKNIENKKKIIKEFNDEIKKEIERIEKYKKYNRKHFVKYFNYFSENQIDETNKIIKLKNKNYGDLACFLNINNIHNEYYPILSVISHSEILDLFNDKSKEVLRDNLIEILMVEIRNLISKIFKKLDAYYGSQNIKGDK